VKRGVRGVSTAQNILIEILLEIFLSFFLSLWLKGALNNVFFTASLSFLSFELFLMHDFPTRPRIGKIAPETQPTPLFTYWYAMGWLRSVGSLKLHVSFAKEPYKRDDILQKRPIILRSLLIVATPCPASAGLNH